MWFSLHTVVDVVLYSGAGILYPGVVLVCPYSYWFPILSVYVTSYYKYRRLPVQTSQELSLGEGEEE
jgi:hypothetical protein